MVGKKGAKAIVLGIESLNEFYKKSRRENPVPKFTVPKANEFMSVEDKARSAAEAKYPELKVGGMWEQYEHKRQREEKIEAFVAGAEFSAPKWIHVTERLPDLNQRVWVCDIDGYDTTCVYKESRYYGGTRLIFENEQDEQPSEIVASHWMELPETPIT